MSEQATIDDVVDGKTAKSLTAAQVLDMLRQRYAAPAHALFANVADATGFDGKRYADAIAMSLWPSRGLELHGFEIKVSRSDWARELKDPAKAEAFAQYCNRWWLVVSDKAIVKPGELPATWGLLAARGGSLVAVVEAPPLTPGPISPAFLAAILRRAMESSVDTEAVKVAEQRGRERGLKQGEANADRRVEEARAYLERLRRQLASFEQASGINIEHSWKHGNIAKALEFMNQGGVDAARRDVDGLLAKARAQVKALEDVQGMYEVTK